MTSRSAGSAKSPDKTRGQSPEKTHTPESHSEPASGFPPLAWYRKASPSTTAAQRIRLISMVIVLLCWLAVLAWLVIDSR